MYELQMMQSGGTGIDWTPVVVALGGLLTSVTGLVSAFTAIKVVELRERLRNVGTRVTALEQKVDEKIPTPANSH